MTNSNIVFITVFIFDHKPIRNSIGELDICAIAPKIPDRDGDRCRLR